MSSSKPLRNRTLLYFAIMLAKTLIAVSLLLPIGHAAAATGASGQDNYGFDKPLRKQVRDLGPSPYYPGGNRPKQQLSCYFYPTLLVKMYDEGQKGAEWLSYLRVQPGHTKSCQLAHEPEEHVIDDWHGYFMGVKGSLVFFTDPDGMDLGIPFAVYDSQTNKKLFEDTAYYVPNSSAEIPPSSFNHLRVYLDPDGQIKLRYLRTKATECDLHLEAKSCWEGLRQQFDIKSSQAPTCTGYAHIKERYSSSIAYAVETTLFPTPTTKTIPGPVRCRPVD